MKVDLVVTDRFVDMIADGIDLAIGPGSLRDSNLITRVLHDGTDTAVRERRLSQASRHPRRIEDLGPARYRRLLPDARQARDAARRPAGRSQVRGHGRRRRCSHRPRPLAPGFGRSPEGQGVQTLSPTRPAAAPRPPRPASCLHRRQRADAEQAREVRRPPSSRNICSLRQVIAEHLADAAADQPPACPDRALPHRRSSAAARPADRAPRWRRPSRRCR